MPQQVGYLPGTTGSIPSGSPGFDSSTKLDTTHINHFVNAGYEFCVRYVSLGSSEDAHVDLDYPEAKSILEAGLGLMPVQHVRAAGWKPSGSLGTQDGKNARDNAYFVGFPARVNVWLDLEGVAAGTPAQDVIDYCNSWFDEVSAWGYVPGLYVGGNCGLNGNQLYYDLKFRHYWKSLSNVPTPVKRGFELVQTPIQPYYGVPIDRDTPETDNLGGNAQWLHM